MEMKVITLSWFAIYKLTGHYLTVKEKRTVSADSWRLS
jgi:hypothetical protein